jgi:predicted nuclease with TOPRIM domain
VNKKIFILVFLYAVSFNSYAENSDVLMRMYERLEMIRIQMQQLTEENQQLNNKIISLQDQQDRLYQDLSKKIEVLNSNLEKNNINIGADSRADIQKKELIKKNYDEKAILR